MNAKLPADVLARAIALKVTGAYQMTSDNVVDDCVQALLEGHVFHAAIPVGPEYEECASEAPVMPASKVYGGHAIAIVGVKTVNGRRLFLNAGSWGTGFGFGGYAWLDESVLLDARASNFIVTTVVPDPAPAAGSKS